MRIKLFASTVLLLTASISHAAQTSMIIKNNIIDVMSTFALGFSPKMAGKFEEVPIEDCWFAPNDTDGGQGGSDGGGSCGGGNGAGSDGCGGGSCPKPN